MRDPKNKSKGGGGNDAVVVEPSAHLDLSISNSQRDIILKPLTRDLTMRELMKDAGGQGATMKIAKRKLNSLATIQSYSCMANNETQLQVLKNKYELAASLAEIDRKDKAGQQAKKNQEIMAKRAKAPDAVAKLAAKGGDVSKLTKLEIVAILLVHYNTHENDNAQKKDYLVNLLQGCIQMQPGNLGISIANGLNVMVTATAQSDEESVVAEPQDVHPGHTHEHAFNEELALVP